MECYSPPHMEAREVRSISHFKGGAISYQAVGFGRVKVKELGNSFADGRKLDQQFLLAFERIVERCFGANDFGARRLLPLAQFLEPFDLRRRYFVTFHVTHYTVRDLRYTFCSDSPPATRLVA